MGINAIREGSCFCANAAEGNRRSFDSLRCAPVAQDDSDKEVRCGLSLEGANG
jgi:hypothetical protein